MVKEEEIYENVRKEGFFRSLYTFLKHPFESIWKVVRYDSLSQQHTKNVNKLTQAYNEINNSEKEIEKQRDEISQQYNYITRLIKREDDLFGRVCKLVNENENLGEQVEFFVNEVERNVKENPGYQNLEKEKEEYKKQVIERGHIIDHLKQDKKKIMEFADYVVREKSNEGLISFLRNSKIPYVLLNPEEQTIIFYNESFEKELEIDKQDLKGKKYHAILDGRDKEGKPNAERIRHIRKFLDLDIKKEFDVNFEKDGKQIPLHITKQPSVSIKIELGPLRKADKEFKVVTCIPLVVEKATTWQKYHPHTLDEVMKKTEYEMQLLEEANREIKNVTFKLVAYKWKEDKKQKTRTSDKIIEVMNKMEFVNAYLFFKNELVKLETETEKKRQEEEEKRKAEKKKEARIRLKKIKAERKKREEKRDKIIKSFKKTYKIKKEYMMKTWNESKNFQDFIYRCREISKSYRTKQN